MNEYVGKFAFSKAGHDKGTCYVILFREEGFLYLCDGKYHTVQKPKKKSLKHVEVSKVFVEENLYKRMMNKEKVFDHEIKYAIKVLKEGKEEGYVKE